MSDTTRKAPAIPRKFTKARQVKWWGREYTVKPSVAKAHDGDGKLLLGFQCMNTRPDYYLIRLDSKFFKGNTDDYHLIGEVIDMLSDEFGEMEAEREYLEEDLREQGIEPTGENTDLAGNEDRLGYPVLSLDSGYHWWEEAILS